MLVESNFEMKFWDVVYTYIPIYIALIYFTTLPILGDML